MSDLLDRLRNAVGVEGLEVSEHGVPTASPASEAEAQAILRLATEAKAAVRPTGSGTKLGWLPPAERVDLYLSTQRLTGVVSYEPEDGTVTARAGTPMAALREIVHAGGHHLSPEVPAPLDGPGPTLGGVIAAAQSGLDRERFGPVRNVLLGTRAVYANGSAAKSGGQLVKNVTGYELHKLHCGSRGALCLITEASLRLFPLAQEECVLTARYPEREGALAAARAVRDLPVRPHAVLAHDLEPPGPWTVAVVLGGLAPAVAWEREHVLGALPGATIAVGENSGRQRTALRDLELASGTWPTLALATRPSRLRHALEELDAGSAELSLESRLLLRPAVARAAVWLRGADGTPLSFDAAVKLHARLSGGSAQPSWLAPPAGLLGEIGSHPAGAADAPLQRRLEAALDPAGAFARARGRPA